MSNTTDQRTVEPTSASYQPYTDLHQAAERIRAASGGDLAFYKLLLNELHAVYDRVTSNMWDRGYAKGAERQFQNPKWNLAESLNRTRDK